MRTQRFPTLGYVQRVYDFLRRHPTWVDGFWAAFLFGVSMLSGAVKNESPGAESPAVIVVVTLLLGLVIALRRRMPERMLVLAAAVGLAQLVLDVEPVLADFAMLVIVYTVAVSGPRWASRFALIGGLCASPLARLRWPDRGESTAGNLALVVFLAVPFALAWVLGDSLRTRRAYTRRPRRPAHPSRYRRER